MWNTNIFPVCLFFLRNKHHWDFWEISMMGKSFYHLRSEPAGKWERVRMEQAGKGNSHRWPLDEANLHFRNQLRAWHWRNRSEYFGGCFIHFSVGGSLLRDTQIVSPSKLTNQLSVKGGAGTEIENIEKKILKILKKLKILKIFHVKRNIRNEK